MQFSWFVCSKLIPEDIENEKRGAIMAILSFLLLFGVMLVQEQSAKQFSIAMATVYNISLMSSYKKHRSSRKKRSL